MRAFIPSPTQGVWHLGPLPLRGYAFCILAGIFVAVVVTQRRWKARGGDPQSVLDIATWAVPLGVVGGRIYHVITSPEAYFGKDGDPIRALYIWEGGLGIWGAVVLGGVGAYIGCRRAGIIFPPFADAVAPAVILAQAVGRWGNWFNNELFGSPTTLPWRLKIYQWDASKGEAVRDSAGHPVLSTYGGGSGYYHPTFLYESIWDLLGFFVLIWADRKYKLGHGRVFALYCCVYTAGRVWIEALRIDDAEHILGLRLNVWTSIVVFLGGLIYLVLSQRFRPGRETVVQRRMADGTDHPGSELSGDSATIPAEEADEDDPLDSGATPAAVTASHDTDVGESAESGQESERRPSV